MEFPPLYQQRLAIEAPLGPTLVVAGPGAGKTFCLIGRIEHLIARQGLAPGRILAVTFTNKAAEEIALRLKRDLAGRADDVTRGTLHALCLSILKDHASAAGLKPGFGVADEQYQRTVLARLGVPPRRRSALLTFFGRRRLQRYSLGANDELLYQSYLTLLARRNLLDFDGLIGETRDLLRARADIAAALAARWDYVLVDEFQDLNAAQYEIVKLLAAPHQNFFAVGDEDQSIFSWTGAERLILKHFTDDYGVAPVILSHNHRCSRQIFETARRVLVENPQIFAKELTADRASEHEVLALGFPDEAAEATWIVDDLEADRARSGLGWGEYALLCRRHRVGEYLEGGLVNAGIPCRLARGRSLVDDPVVGWVIGALRVLRAPDDPVAVEAFARLVFSKHLIEEVRASGAAGDLNFREHVRALARARPADDPDTKKLWRFVYFIENLRSLPHQVHGLSQIVSLLLSQQVGRYKNALEDRHDELTDPAGMPEAVRLAERLQRALETEAEVVIEPMGGLEIALRGMLVVAGFRHVPYARTGGALGPADAGSDGLALTMFKALQLLQSREIGSLVPAFVAFDLETTDNDIATCDIIEIGAARVRDGKVVGEFHALVRPSRPIAPAATKAHGYSDADVAGARTLAEIWPEFRDFVGDDLLVAHNGQYFDVPVLRRLAAGWDGLSSLVFYDTLPLAKSLSPEGARLVDLAARFGIDTGRSHHALDDAITLAHVFRGLERERQVRARKSVCADALDWLGLALALEASPADAPGTSDERRVLVELTRSRTLGRWTDCLDVYAQERAQTGVVSPPLEEIIDRLGGAALMERLRAAPDPAQRYPAAVARLRALIDPDPDLPLDVALDRLLERVALSSSEGADVSPDRVNILTLHSTKGLEFSRVYVVGMEDYQLPGYYATVDRDEDEIQEARRLAYVGMTRAKDRLVLTRVDRRFGRDAGGSMFLEEMGLVERGVALK